MERYSIGGKFSYQGYLIFNEAFKIDIPDNSPFSADIEQVKDLLGSEFSGPQLSDSGYERAIELLPLYDNFSEQTVSEVGVPNFIDRIIPIRFFYEKRIDSEGYLPGSDNLIDIEIPTVKDADIYWMYPNRMYFRGAQSDVAEAVAFMRSILDARMYELVQSDPSTEDSTISSTEDYVLVNDGPDSPYTDGGEQVKMIRNPFSGDFLFWLFSQYFSGNDLRNASDIRVNQFTDAAVSGNVDIWGGNSKVNDTSELADSPPLLSALLNDKYFSALEGSFDIGGNTLRSRIQISKVHVKASFGDIEDADPTRRMNLSLMFLQQLVDLHQHWLGLNPADRYPDYNFLLELHQRCIDLGIEIDHISRTMRRRYRDLRGDNDRDWQL